MVPVYLKYMGAETYGLVGFFAMLQAWFQLLDMGLTPTMARETARFNGGAIDALSLRRLLRALEGIFICVALLGGMAMVAGSGFIANSWLKVQVLSLDEVQHVIKLMAVIIALRWMCGLYRGAINGFERMLWLNGFNIAVATTRFVLVIPYFIYVGASPTEFFSYQALLAIIELLVLVIQTYRLLPNVSSTRRVSWRLTPLLGVLKFSLSIAFTSSVWVLVTQTDKLVLSKFLPLVEYAYFTLAVVVASGVMMISGPISGALLPRMTKLNAEGDEESLIQLYRNATQMIAVIAIPAALMLAFFAEQVLWVWTGNADIARKSAPVLMLYALGNGILAMGAFPYYLQFAKGDLKMHLIGNALFVVLLIPTLIWASIQYGAIGAGFAWLGTNIIYFLLWVPQVHRRFLKGLHKVWLLQDVAGIVLLTGLFAFFSHQLIKWPTDRVVVLVLILMLSVILVIIAGTASSWTRTTIIGIWRKRFLGGVKDSGSSSFSKPAKKK